MTLISGESYKMLHPLPGLTDKGCEFDVCVAIKPITCHSSLFTSFGLLGDCDCLTEQTVTVGMKRARFWVFDVGEIRWIVHGRDCLAFEFRPRRKDNLIPLYVDVVKNVNTCERLTFRAPAPDDDLITTTIAS